MSLDSLRVLHVGKFYPPHCGGLETHLQELCEGLPRCFDLSVIVANDKRQTVRCSVRGVDVTRVGSLGTLASSPTCFGMAEAIRSTPADIIHLHHPNPMAFLAYLLSGHRGRLVVTYHSDIIRQRWLSPLVDPLLRAVLRRSSAIILSSFPLFSGSSLLRPFRERCHVIPFGITTERFEQVDPRAVSEIRERYGPKIVLAVGRLVYYKGFKYLIRAMRRVQGNLVLVGEGPLRQRLEREIRAHGVEDRVFLLGRVPDLDAYYKAADVFVLPSVARSEAFGIVQLEAMACGKPVVNTTLDSGVPFVSMHGITGVSVPPADADALAEAIGLLLGDPELSSRYGEAGRKRVRERFGLETMIARTAQLYGQVMGETAVAAEERAPARPAPAKMSAQTR